MNSFSPYPAGRLLSQRLSDQKKKKFYTTRHICRRRGRGNYCRSSLAMLVHNVEKRNNVKRGSKQPTSSSRESHAPQETPRTRLPAKIKHKYRTINIIYNLCRVESSKFRFRDNPKYVPSRAAASTLEYVC